MLVNGFIIIAQAITKILTIMHMMTREKLLSVYTLHDSWSTAEWEKKKNRLSGKWWADLESPDSMGIRVSRIALQLRSRERIWFSIAKDPDRIAGGGPHILSFVLRSHFMLPSSHSPSFIFLPSFVKESVVKTRLFEAMKISLP